MKNLIARFVSDDQGQDLIEYALLAGFVSLSATAALTLIGPRILTLYQDVDAALVDANTP